MVPDLYLIAPADAAASAFVPVLKRVLAAASIAALLLPKGNRSIAEYEAYIGAVASVAQENGCAVLIEGDPAAVSQLAVDGLHVAGSLPALKAAIAALKPDFIVGAGPIASRHEAMSAGELGLDYILFGPLSGATDPAARELAGWWAETMEVPGVFSDPQVSVDAPDTAGSEFLALSESLWAAADPAAFVAALADRLEQSA